MRLSLFVAAAMLSASLAAHAETLYYTFTGVESNGRNDTLTFSTSSTGPFFSGNGFFSTGKDTITFNGSSDSRSQTFEPAENPGVTVLSTAEGNNRFAFDFLGSLYSGSTSNPTLLPGTFTLDTAETDNSLELQAENSFRYSSGTLVASTTPFTTPTVTPEPSSFALLGTGLLGALGVARKRFA